MVDKEPDRNAISFLMEDIARIPERIPLENPRTGQAWIICLGSGLQAISADISVIERSGEMTGKLLGELKAKFQTVVDLWRMKKRELAESGREISEDEKQELMDLVNNLL